MAEHADLEALAGYWLAELPAAAEQKLEEHFFACARCAGRLEWLAALTDGVRTAMRGGRVGLFVPARFVEALAQAGMRLREYRLEAGGSVNCTIRAEDDAVVSRLRAPLAGVKRIDALQRVSAGGPDEREERVADVPFAPEAGELLFIPTAARLKRMPSHTLRMRLVAVDETGERPLAEYTFRHIAG
jgi:hypothetical protein